MSARLTVALVPVLLFPSVGIARAAAPTTGEATLQQPVLFGTVRRAGDRSPLGGVALFVYPAAPGARLGEVRSPLPAADEPPWLRRIETDENGDFKVIDLPQETGDRLTIELVVAGYRRARWIIDPSATPKRGYRLFVRREASGVYRTTVVTKKQSHRTVTDPAPVERQLSREELRTLPGSQGDPLRAIQSLPGVARAPFGLGLLVLRGASPRQSQVFVGDHPIPFAFHLSGLSTVLPAGVLDDLSFAPSNFAPTYGNASGGLIVMGPRAGRRDAHHGEAFLDFGGLGAQAEGPVGKGSFLVAARRAHLDLPLRVVGSLNPYSAAIYPRYYDYQAFYDRPLGGGRHLHVGFIGAGDRLSFRSAAETERERETYLEPQMSFHRFDVAYRARVDKTSILITPALRLDSNHLKGLAFSSLLTKPRRGLVSTIRAQIDHRLTPEVTLVLGADAEIGRETTETSVPTSPDMTPETVLLTGSAVNSNTTSRDHVYLGLYGEAVFRRDGTMLAIGTRASAFVVDGKDRFAVDPRLRLRQTIGERVSLSAGLGYYSQPWIGRRAGSFDLLVDYQPTTAPLILPDVIRDNYNPLIFVEELDIRVIRALQGTLGGTVELGEGAWAEAHAFVRDLQDQSRPAQSAQDGGLAYGGEFTLRKRLTRNLYGWVAYTLMWAKHERRSPDARTLGVGPYDQRHNLVAVLSMRLPHDWQVGGRFRLSSGLPYTPVIGVIGSAGVDRPIYGAYLGDTFPLFHQLDLRVDKRWVLKRTILAAYVDIQNVYNHQNTEAYFYTSDYRRRVGGLSMPILPLIGVRVEL